jgi:hypothetical protein
MYITGDGRDSYSISQKLLDFLLSTVNPGTFIEELSQQPGD